MNTIPSFYPAILRPFLIGVTAGKCLHLNLCENKGLHYVFANQFTSCSLPKWFTRWCFSCQKGRLSSALVFLLTARLTGNWMLDALRVLGKAKKDASLATKYLLSTISLQLLLRQVSGCNRQMLEGMSNRKTNIYVSCFLAHKAQVSKTLLARTFDIHVAAFCIEVKQALHYSGEVCLVWRERQIHWN